MPLLHDVGDLAGPHGRLEKDLVERWREFEHRFELDERLEVAVRNFSAPQQRGVFERLERTRQTGLIRTDIQRFENRIDQKLVCDFVEFAGMPRLAAQD